MSENVSAVRGGGYEDEDKSYLAEFVKKGRREPIKREGELKIGGNKFEGHSSYTDDYLGKSGGRQ